MKTNKIFFSDLLKTVVVLSGVFLMNFDNANAAAVTQRPSGLKAAPRANRASSVNANVTAEIPVDIVEPAAVTVEPVAVIENKSEQFNTVLQDTGASTVDASSTALGDKIRAQRAALDAAASTSTAVKKQADALSAGANKCDTDLRACMKTKCGNDFSNCSGDGDTDLGNKLNSCKLTITCSGSEFDIFSKEIKEDIASNLLLKSYSETVDCGNRYNKCIVSQCGTKFEKCLGKNYEDAAIAKCDTENKNCINIDNGLSSRTRQVFGTLRVSAEKQVQKDEAELYAMRDQMKTICGNLGAMFDERSLDCVYTVNFWANNSNTPYASKKAYAGGTYDCDQDWFGIDVTTFKENAYRLTRSQTAASSAMMGSGLGTAVSSITSGAIGRSLDTAKAKGALNDAKKEETGAGKSDDKKSEKIEDDDKQTKESNNSEGSSSGSSGSNGIDKVEIPKAKDGQNGGGYTIGGKAIETEQTPETKAINKSTADSVTSDAFKGTNQGTEISTTPSNNSSSNNYGYIYGTTGSTSSSNSSSSSSGNSSVSSNSTSTSSGGGNK